MSNKHLFGMGDEEFESLILSNALKFDVLDSIDDFEFRTVNDELKLFKGDKEIFSFSAEDESIKINSIDLGHATITTNNDLDPTTSTIDYDTYNPYGAIGPNTTNLTSTPIYEQLCRRNIAYVPDYNEIYTPDSNQGVVTDIPFHKVTHIFFGFMWAKPSQADYNTAVGQGFTYDGFYDASYLDGTLIYRNKTITESSIGFLRRVRDQYYPHLKIIVSIGGGSLSWNISKVLADTTLRTNFVNSIVGFIKMNDLDGVDIDWEYPTQANKAWSYADGTNDIPNYKTFLTELRAKFDACIPKKNIEISIISGNYQSIISKFDGMEPYVDYINIMTYDFAGPTYNGRNPHTSLNEFLSGSNRYAKKSVEFMNTLSNFPLHRINFGTASYGYGWDGITKPGDSTNFYGTGGSPAVNFRNGDADGTEFYNEIVKKYKADSSYVVTRDVDSSIVSLQKDNGDGTWEIWTYEDHITAGLKAQYVIDAGIGGIFNWEITRDTLTDDSTSILHATYEKFLKLQKSSLSFITNDMERMRIDRNGAIGINNPSPDNSYLVDMNGDLNVDGDINFTGKINLSGTQYGGGFQVDGDDIYNVNSGNIGIGTSNPISKVHIEVADTAAPPMLILSNTSEDRGGIRFMDSSAPDSQNFDIVYDNSLNNLIIRSDNNDNIMFMEETGNVGINTDDPRQKLDVSGSATISGDLGIGTNSPDAAIHISGDATSANPAMLLITNDTEDRGGIRLADGQTPDTQNFDILYDSLSENLIFKSDTTDSIMVLKPNGNVGIGTSTPDRELVVNGIIKCEQLAQTFGNVGETIEEIFTSNGNVESVKHVVNTTDSTFPSHTIEVENNLGVTKSVLSGNGSTFDIYTNNTSRFNIDNSGNVGVGISPASNRLHVHDSSQTSNKIQLTNSLSGSTSTDGLQLELNNSDAQVNNRENGDLVLLTNNTERMRLTSTGVTIDGNNSNHGIFLVEQNGTEVFRIEGNGRVGIGTNNPQNQLHIEGPDDATPPMMFLSNTSEDWGGIRLGDSSAPQSQNFDILFNAQSQDFKIRSDDVDNIIYFETAGDVGLGTDDPTAKLDINENSTDTMGLIIRNGNGSAITNNGGQISLAFNGTNDYQHFIHTRHNTTDSSNAIDFYVSDGTQNNSILTGSKHNMSLVSGQVGVGISAPNNILHLHTPDSDGTLINFTNSATGTGSGDGFQIGIQGSDESVQFWLFENNYMRWATNGTERMRLSSGGNLGIGKTPASNVRLDVQSLSTDVCGNLYRPTSTTTDNLFQCRSDVGGTSNLNFLVEADGDVGNRNGTYGTLSDERVKENIVDASSQWEDIKSIEFKNYNLISEPNKTLLGVIAQQVEDVSPGLVKDSDITIDGVDNVKSVKTSILYMKGMVALKESLERIETLETTVANQQTTINTLETTVANQQTTIDNQQDLIVDILQRLNTLENN